MSLATGHQPLPEPLCLLAVHLNRLYTRPLGATDAAYCAASADARPGKVRGSDCLTDEVILEWLHGGLSEQGIEECSAHLDRCAACRELVSELARGPTEPAAIQPGAGELLRPGALFGRYRIQRPLGMGGMGVVYLAQDTSLGRAVALKLLHPSIDRGRADAHARLLRESRALALLNHPNVVTVHEVAEHRGAHYLAMEFVEGGVVTDWLAGQPRSLGDVLALFRQAAAGLAAAHDAGIVHRDFKPDNLLVGRGDRAKVSDFGLAHAESLAAPDDASVAATGSSHPTVAGSELTSDGVVVGTPRYMAPEVRIGYPADARSDQWSFAAALDEVLTGALGRERRLPRRLRRVLDRALADDPARRWPSMHALAGQLVSPGRRRLVQAVAALALAAGAIAVGRASGHEDDPVCRGAADHLAGAWGAPQRAAVNRALRATRMPYAAAAAIEVRRELDRYAAGWITMHTDACQATRVRGDQTEDQLGLRMRCLDRRLGGLAALVERLGHADREIASRAVDAVRRLDDVEDCADLETLARPVPPPSDPAARRRVNALDADLAGVRAFEAAGQVREGLVAARRLTGEADATGHRPLQAEAHLAAGQLADQTGDLDLAERELQRAVWAAEAGRHDLVAARGWLALTRVVGHHRARYGEVPALEARATAAIERLGGDDALEVELGSLRATLAVDQGHYDDAERQLGEVLARIARRAGGDNLRSVEPLRALVSIAFQRDQPARALEQARRALAIQRPLLGDDHPDVAATIELIAGAEYMAGEYDVAEADYRRSQAIFELALGPAHQRVGNLLHNLGLVHLMKGDTRAAIAALRRAVAITEAVLGPDHPSTATQLDSLAGALETDGRLDEARQVLDRVLAILRAHYGDQHPLIARALHSLAMVELERGRARDALDTARRSLAMRERLLGKGDPETGDVLRTIGEARLALGQPAAAVEPLTRARALSAGRADDAFTLRTTGLLGRALYDSGRDRARGRSLALEALRGMTADGRMDDQRRELASWLARRGLRRR